MKGTISSATMLATLIMGLITEPAVSLKERSAIKTSDFDSSGVLARIR